MPAWAGTRGKRVRRHGNPLGRITVGGRASRALGRFTVVERAARKADRARGSCVAGRIWFGPRRPPPSAGPPPGPVHGTAPARKAGPDHGVSSATRPGSFHGALILRCPPHARRGARPVARGPSSSGGTLSRLQHTPRLPKLSPRNDPRSPGVPDHRRSRRPERHTVPRSTGIPRDIKGTARTVSGPEYRSSGRGARLGRWLTPPRPLLGRSASPPEYRSSGEPSLSLRASPFLSLARRPLSGVPELRCSGGPERRRAMIDG